MSDRRGRGPFPWRVHPIWRGIGFLLLIIVPFMAYSLADVIWPWMVEQNPALQRSFTGWAGFLNNPFTIKIIITVVLSMVIYLVFSTLGSLLFSLMGGREDENIASLTRDNRR